MANDSLGARTTLASLNQVYWYPLYAHLRRRGYHERGAEDLVQSFYAFLQETHAIAKTLEDRGAKSPSHFLLELSGAVLLACIMRTTRFASAAIALLLVLGGAIGADEDFTKDVPKSADHPALKRLKDSVIVSYSKQAFGEQ